MRSSGGKQSSAGTPAFPQAWRANSLRAITGNLFALNSDANAWISDGDGDGDGDGDCDDGDETGVLRGMLTAARLALLLTMKVR